MDSRAKLDVLEERKSTYPVRFEVLTEVLLKIQPSGM
jgi:hypothetical protein